jgi:C4-dicarboxylate transporter DctM subunit
MDFITGGILCIGLLLGLMGAGLQIGLAFILSGVVVSTILLGFNSALSLLGQVAYFSIASPTWACIPLFILMGSFATGGGFARRAYLGVNALVMARPDLLGSPPVSAAPYLEPFPDLPSPPRPFSEKWLFRK